MVDSASRLYVIAGKHVNSTGDDVSNDVWVATTAVSGSTITFTWTQQTAAAPFAARDGPGGATYFSPSIGVDVLYVAGGYTYNSIIGQSNDNGLGDNTVWASIDQGATWTNLGKAQWSPRYHNKMLATRDGVLVSYGGSYQPPPTSGGNSELSDIYQNDLWVSMDGGFTWGSCNSAVLPAYQNTSSATYARGAGRQDVLMQIDPATGLLYMGSGREYNAVGSTREYPGDLYVSTISLFNLNAVASACGLSMPYGGTGLLSAPVMSLVTLTPSGPFLPRQQGGLLVVNKTGASVLTSTGTVTSAQSSLVLFGGEYPGGSVSADGDVWYSTSGQSWSSVTLSGGSTFASQAYGPATCVDNNQQVLYSVGGDQSGGDTAGTAAVQYSSDLGQTWTTVTGGFPGRANAVCYVDSFSRLVVIAGKLANTSGVAVSNDVWVGTPSNIPPTPTSTFTWSQQSAAAPFSPRDGPLGASYFSTVLQTDVYYLAGGYAYQNAVAQFNGDNGVGDSEVWASLDQGATWKLIANNQFPARYHGKLVATQDGVLVVVAGANAPPTYSGGSQQHSSYLRNDMWASLDGGFTWGQCATQLFPLAQGYNASQSNSFARGSGREDPVLAIDPATGYLYMGQGLQRYANGSAAYPTDLYRSSISFYSIGQVAGLCGDLAIPVGGVGLQAPSLSQVSLVPLTSTGPFLPRQQGGLYVVDSYSADVYTNVVTATGTITAQQSALVLFGGEYPGGSVSADGDVWYSTSGQSWSSVTLSGGSTFASQAYGPATCVDNNQQVLYSVGGDQSGGDTAGTAAVQYSSDLGQTWTTVTGGFPGRANAVCYVDSFSRVVVIAGKLANTSGVAVSNDVWVGTPSNIPPTPTSTFTWSQQSAAAPFSPRDGPLGASYFSTVLQTDVYYLAGGYAYQNAVAQFNGDNGVGDSEVWASLDQGATWKLIANNQFPARYHGKLVATQDGVLVVVAGANAPPTYSGGSQQHSSYLRNDMWASLDGGFTWGQCATQLFPLAQGYNASQSNSFARGSGREDPVLAIDPATGYLYMGQGLQRYANGSAAYPTDLYRSSISFYSIGQVAGLCGDLAIPVGGVGLQAPSLSQVSLVPLTSTGPFLPRQQGGLYVVDSYSADMYTNVVTATGTITAQQSALVLFGGEYPGGSVSADGDVWYSTSGQSWSSVTLSGGSTFASQAYGPATCVDNNQQVLYSVGGDQSGGDTAGTAAVQYSSDLGQTWTTVTGGFPGRANAVCYVDSFSRVVVIAGKLANTSGVAVSNDVWVGTPSNIPPTPTSTFTWSQQSAAAPFSPRDGPLGASYFSTVLQTDVYYLAGGYAYQNAVAQFNGDNGVGDSEVWASLDQGATWKLIANNQFPARYHGKLVATQDGVLVVVAGANAPPTYSGGSQQHSSYLRNDMWASLDGGFTWGQCATQLFPLAQGYNASQSNSFARGSGREDPVLAIDPATGYLYMGQGLQRYANGSAAYPTDLYRSSISFYSIGQVAGLCGDLAIPVGGVGLQAPSLSQVSLVPLTSTGPFLPRQQGGLYVVDSYSADVYTNVVTATGTITAQQSALVLFGGEYPGGSVSADGDVWYSTSGQSWSSVTLSGGSTFASQAYGPATCVDNNQQVLYSVGGDQSGGDTAGTAAVQYSSDLGQTWTTVTGGFPGRANAVCYVDSFSRLVVIAGKLANTSGVAVSNDVWVGTPSNIPPTPTSTFTWSQQSAAAPFSPRDGPLGASYFSTVLQTDVYYLAGGYAYQNAVAQFNGDNGVGDSEVWASLDQGATWKLIANNQFPARYHGKLVATQDGVLVVVAGANAPPTYSGGSQQHSSYLRNDMWASLDGGFTWGQCATQLFPLAQGYNASQSNSFARGSGREDPVLAIDPATGYLYMGQGLQRYANGSAAYPTDLYRSSISFYSIGQVAGLCGDLAIPVGGVGLQAPSLSQVSLVPLTSTGPFLPRQQGGLYVVDSYSADVYTNVVTATGTITAQQSALVLFGGEYPGGSVSADGDVWYSTSGQSWSSVTLSGGSTFASQAYGPATCVDNNQQVLYSVGGDQSGGDTAGTAAVQYSSDLGQTWTTVTGGFPGRANAVCYVDSFSRLVVIAGKLANTSGVAVSNDVWVGTPSNIPPTSTSTFAWVQKTPAAPFQARDGPLGATYFSTALQTDVYYVVGGYDYETALAQFDGDNGVGDSEVWASIDQGATWKLIANNQFPPRYHGKLLATQDGVLVILAGANAPPTTDGGLDQGSSYLLNDMWASLDGGYTWGQCSSQVFPNASGSAGPFARGNGREDPMLAIDPATGYLYMGQGLQRYANGSAAYPTDLYRSSISFYSIGQVAGLCGDLAIPVGGVGLQAPSLSQVSLVPLTSTGPFLPRQQGGLYVVDSYSADVYTNVVTATGTITAQQSALVLFGGEYPGGSVSADGDVWYSTSGQSWSSVTLSGGSTFASQAYGPATCVDNNQQVLYSVGGDQSGGDTAGTAAVQYSSDLGQTWTTVTGGFPGRANAVCYVDSFSRLVVIAGKLANTSGVAVSNDVWVGTPSNIPPTSTSTFAWVQKTPAAPFQARDGPLGATYFSTALQTDVYYVVGGYDYETALAQFDGDNGVGDSEVWASIDQGATWKLIANNQFPPRYHGKLLATQDGVLVILAGANAPPTTDGGLDQGSSYLLNDMWASLDGGYTWGQCSSQVFPNASGSAGPFARGNGREDPMLAIDPATGYLYMGQGLQRYANGSAAYPTDLYRSSISFYSIGQVAGLCGVVSIPAAGVGLLAPPVTVNVTASNSSSSSTGAVGSTSTTTSASSSSASTSTGSVNPTSATNSATSASSTTSTPVVTVSSASSTAGQGGASSTGGAVANSGGSSGLSGGAIAGIVIGSVVGVAILLALCLLILFKGRERKQPTAVETSKVGTTNRPHTNLNDEASSNASARPTNVEMVEVA